jgi:hypothetical protein
MAEQVDAGVARARHEHIQASHLPDVAELPGADHDPGEGGHPGQLGMTGSAITAFAALMLPSPSSSSQPPSARSIRWTCVPRRGCIRAA